MALLAGATVANLWYNQPLLGVMGATLHRPAVDLGPVATLTQAGYAAGLLFWVPLGDMVDRKRLLLGLLAAVGLALVAESMAANLASLEVAAFIVGAATPIPQIVVPLAADLASSSERGRVVGTVMSGLLIGVLAARTVAGFIAEWLGWRMVFRIAAGLMVGLAALVGWLFPDDSPRPAGLSYVKGLGSLWPLFRSEPELTSAALTGSALFGTFSGFWTALTFLLRGAPFHFTPQTIGLFGLVGIGGAVAAPLAGRLADHRDPRDTVTWALWGSGLAMIWLALAPRRVWAIVVGIILLDVATQSGQISNQSRIYALSQTARSRLNTVYMVWYFVGGAAGAGMASLAWKAWGWTGVPATGMAFLLVGGLWHRWAYQKTAVHQP